MLGLLLMSISGAAPDSAAATFPCEGIAMIEASTRDRPRAFGSLRQAGKEMATVRNAAGQRVQREIDVFNVKPLVGFSNCRYVYSGRIDLACYVGATLPESDAQSIAETLDSTAQSIGACLKNTDLLRSPSEPGSTPSISFGGGPTQSFWQISMVPSRADPSRIQPELLVLGPALVTPPPRVAKRPKSKAKRKAR